MKTFRIVQNTTYVDKEDQLESFRSFTIEERVHCISDGADDFKWVSVSIETFPTVEHAERYICEMNDYMTLKKVVKEINI